MIKTTLILVLLLLSSNPSFGQYNKELSLKPGLDSIALNNRLKLVKTYVILKDSIGNLSDTSLATYYHYDSSGFLIEIEKFKYSERNKTSLGSLRFYTKIQYEYNSEGYLIKETMSPSIPIPIGGYSDEKITSTSYIETINVNGRILKTKELTTETLGDEYSWKDEELYFYNDNHQIDSVLSSYESTYQGVTKIIISKSVYTHYKDLFIKSIIRQHEGVPYSRVAYNYLRW